MERVKTTLLLGESSAFQVNYENVDQPEISYSGWIIWTGTQRQASFDFIQVGRMEYMWLNATPALITLLLPCLQPSRVADAYLSKELAEP